MDRLLRLTVPNRAYAVSFRMKKTNKNQDDDEDYSMEKDECDYTRECRGHRGIGV